MSGSEAEAEAEADEEEEEDCAPELPPAALMEPPRQ
jgi:hypothetical protein